MNEPDSQHISRRDFVKAAAGTACAMAGVASAETPASLPASSPASFPTSDESFVREASYWTPYEGDLTAVRCRLCPHHCIVPERERGLCGVRECRDGRLVTLVYGRACKAVVVPIEERNLWHFLPGERTLTVAAAGCNLSCRGCNEWQFSQSSPDFQGTISADPGSILQVARTSECDVLAFGITEPVVAWEWLKDCLIEARGAGMKTVLSTNGYLAGDALSELIPHLSAVKVDLKGFNDDYYQTYCMGRLEPVLETILALKKGGVWLEIAWPVVPGGNDKEDEAVAAAKWILDKLGRDVPLHFLRHDPAYRLKHVPETSRRSLTLLRKLCMREGLHHVYVHGVDDHEGRKTYCPSCLLPVVLRSANRIESGIDKGRCGACHSPIAGVWKAPTIQLGTGSESVV